MITTNDKSYLPAYVQLKKELLQKIDSGEFKENDKLPSFRQMSKTTGLAYITVSRAVSELIEEGFLYSIHGKGTFVAERDSKTRKVSRELRIGILGNPALSFPVMSNITPFTYELLQGVNDIIANNGHTLVPFLETGIPLLESLKENPSGVDGLIILNGDNYVHIFQKLPQMKIPHISINKPYEGYNGNYVGVSDYNGMFSMTEYLITKGHKKFLFLKHAHKTLSYRERFRGFNEALEKHGLSIEDQAQLLTNPNIESGHEEVRDYLSSVSSYPTAIVGATDPVAFGAVQAVREKGLSVPEDIAVAGYMDLEILRTMNIAVTTVRMPIKEMGKAAVKAFEDILLDEKDGPVQVEFETELVIRNTA
ncbi:MAG: GntR family transcriptional regulator [Planctomycetota bacterium]|jgi:LacI family transcriptional regulator